MRGAWERRPSNARLGGSTGTPAWRCAVGGGVAMLLCACSTGPAYRPPEATLPAVYAGQAEAPRGDAGVSQASIPAEVLAQEERQARYAALALGDDSLRSLISTALSSNPDIDAAMARVRRARAELGLAQAPEWPTLEASGRVGRDAVSRNGENFANIPFPNPRTRFTDYRGGFDSAWEIDLFGRNRQATAAAGARLAGSEYAAGDLRWTLAAEVARGYVALRVTERRLALARADLESLRTAADLIDQQQAAGRAGAGEPLQARAAIDDQEAAVAGLVADRAAALNALAQLLATDRAALEPRLAAGGPIPVAAPIAPGLPSDLLRRRPDLRRAEREVAAASADLGVATADLYPRFTLVGNAGLDAIRPGEFARQASQFWSLGPQFTLPLFNHGALRAQVAGREAAREEALAAYRKAVLQALTEVEDALVRLAAAREGEQALAQAAQRQEADAGLVERQFEAGRASRLDLLAAERRVRAAQAQRALAAGDLATQSLALMKGLGGDGAAPAFSR